MRIAALRLSTKPEVRSTLRGCTGSVRGLLCEIFAPGDSQATRAIQFG
ncbi:hypothetical protein RRSWK_05751 [Rhodopirellula sp. SWK7]|nr:hypothetical protein RRSWK_05751 [Rhodopirellula sp. SWK7]